ncbi:12263_t:CDS:1, partial [Gigaspora margarita]
SSLFIPMKSTVRDTKHMKSKVITTTKSTTGKTKLTKNQRQESELFTTTPSNNKRADERNTRMMPI